MTREIFLPAAIVSGLLDSNQRPLRPERSALPTALNPDFRLQRYGKNLKQEHFIQEKYEKICIIGKKAVPLHSLLKSNDIGAIAQLVEQRTENPCVPGSIPGGTTATSKRVIRKGDSFFCPS